ncbi:MAG: hypothetical protein U0231_01785 [Nitrospiraceae bacterium]
MKGDGGGYGFDRISEIGGRVGTGRFDRKTRLPLHAQQCAELKDFLARVEVVYKHGRRASTLPLSRAPLKAPEATRPNRSPSDLRLD